MTDGRDPVDPRMDSELNEPEQVTVAPDWQPADRQPAWRTDFPIDWPQDHYIERREFMKFMVLTSLAFTVGQFWIAIESWMRRSAPAPALRIATVDDVPVGSVRVYSYPGEEDPCLLVRLDENTFISYGQKCTHLSCAVIPNVEAGDIRCPCHEGLFDLASGRPLAGPPRRPLTRVSVEVRDGQIFATGVVERTV